MTIPERSWIRFIRKLSTIRDTAARKLAAYLNDPRHEFMSSRGRKAAIDYAAALADAYGESAAAVACQMYDAIAVASHMKLPPAVPAPTPTYGEVAKTVNGMIKQNQSNEAIGSSIGRLVKRTEADTTMQNAIRDGAEFAWVPNGDTCPFCIMLASNGWKRASKKTIKGDHVEHIHANCDCTFAIRFDGKSSVVGYDPDKYKAIYDNAEGDTWEEKLNSMRRDEYGKNADKINAQKRNAYTRREGAFAGIHKRTPGYGRPVNVALSNAPLNERQRSILEKLTGYDSRDIFNKRDVSMQDLAALTAHTGDEFAMFTRGSERLIIRGGPINVNILPKDGADLAAQGYSWSGHTHPGLYLADFMPSPGDRSVLQAMGQTYSSIYSPTGRCFIFGIRKENDLGFRNLSD